MRSSIYGENIKSAVVNFVWLGPPAFNHGGQDVMGIDSFVDNFRQFGQENPLVFWCQEAYKQEYLEYFAKNKMNVTVYSIEEHLQRAMQNSNKYAQETATTVFNIYQLLMSAERTVHVDEAIQIKDRMRIKNLFFLFLMATQGGYVLDTNICALPGTPITLPSYDQFHFPWVEARKITRAEIWMEYSPVHDLSRAKLSLDLLLEQYNTNSNFLNAIQEDNEFGTGMMALNCVTFFENQFIENMMWKAKFLPNSEDYIVPELNIVKEYYNSHKNTPHKYSAKQLHALRGQVDKVRNDVIKYKIDPGSFSSNTLRNESGLNYDASNETLLHIAMREMGDDDTHLQCAEIYLDHGAKPNAIYHYTAYNRDGMPIVTRERSSLFDAILNRSLKGMHLLFKHHVDLSQYIETDTALIFAIKRRFNEGVEALLNEQANPNQLSKDYTNSPLVVAMQTNNIPLVELLLRSGANPNQLVKRPSKGATVYFASSLNIALQLKNPACVELLLKFGADPQRFGKVNLGGKQYPIPFSNIETNKECIDVLSAFVKENAQDSTPAPTPRLSSHTFIGSSSGANDQQMVEDQSKSM